jgi:hypothetical protein
LGSNVTVYRVELSESSNSSRGVVTMRKRKLLVLLVAFAFVACSTSSPTVTPEPTTDTPRLTNAPEPTATATRMPTDTPTPTSTPTPEPTDTPAPTATSSPTPTSTPEGWVWWADQMTCNEQDECMPPEEVADEIITAFWEWREAIPFYYYELDMTPEQLEYYYIGEILRLQLEFISLVEETGAMWDGETIVREFEVETRVPHVIGCELDGLTCLLGETIQGNITLHEYDLSILQIVNSVENPQDKQYHGVNIWRFQYDLDAKKWKVERYYDWVPAPG